jgi:multicomponent Na+:H+ antiporter subunit B
MIYSNIFRIAARNLRPMLLVLSIVVLYRGHNQPGGGFIGGLLAASAYILYAMAYGADAARLKLRLPVLSFLGVGLSVILLSGLWGLFTGENFLTGRWIMIDFPLLSEIHFGTPMLFDFGVYITVIGVLLTIMFSIMEID